MFGPIITFAQSDNLFFVCSLFKAMIAPHESEGDGK
jgi:hypothetical protein